MVGPESLPGGLILLFSFFTVLVSAALALVPATGLGGAFARLQMMAIALGLLIQGLSAKSADADYVLRATSGVRWIFILVPAAIAAQMLPLPLSFAHPIWASTYEALQTGPFGYITADLGDTLQTLFVALAAIATIGVTILTSRDRRRAEFTLVVLSAILTLQTILSLGRQTLLPATRPDVIGATVALAGFGVLLNLALIQLAVERGETRHEINRSIAIGVAGLIGTTINAGYMIRAASAPGLVALGFGIVLFALIVVIRRLDLSLFPRIALCAAALIGGSIALTWAFENGSDGPALLKFVTGLNEAAKASYGRMLADVRLYGAGAGAFGTLGRIYQDADPGAALSSPSAAAAILVDMGVMGLVGTIIALLALLAKLFAGSLRRGRDSFFPTAAAAAVAYSTVALFVDGGLTDPAPITVFALILGLGLSQSVSQSPRR